MAFLCYHGFHSALDTDDFICFYSEGGVKDEDMPTNAPTPQRGDTKTLLREGISAVKSGRRDRARELLTRVVEQDEENARAWLWLGGVVDSLDDREVCLENVLALDPGNEMARRGLGILRQQRANQLLREGISAGKSGQRDRARELLMRVVEQDQENVQAWLWLSGVVDDLDDQQICLENVLALDPDNDIARRGLTWVRNQREAQSVVSTEVVPFSSTGAELEPSLAPSLSGVDAHPLAAPEAVTTSPSTIKGSAAAPYSAPEPETFVPTPQESPPTSIAPSDAKPADAFDDEYLCFYCAAPTEPNDRRCKTCGGKLWVKYRKEEERSTWLWVALALQGLNTLPLLVLPLLLAFLVFDLGGSQVSAMVSQAIGMYTSMLGMSSGMIERLTMVAFIATLFIALLSLAVLIGLYLRWKPAFYLFLASAVLGLFWTVANIIMSFSPDSAFTLAGAGSLICSGLNVLMALARLMLAFQIQDDFAFERRRVLLQLDPDVRSGAMILARGHEYAKRKMWALAALHMRRAALAMPNQVSPHVALTLTYLRMKRHDLAAGALEDARRIDPDDPHVAELQDLLDELRSSGNVP
jgi:tetratricopeptide (TPR) repeat protein